MDHLGKISTGFSLEGSRRIVRALRGLVVGVLLARHLGPEQYGTYSYALSIGMLLGAFIPFGLDGILTREFTQSSRSPRPILISGMLGRMFGAGVLIVGVPIYLAIGKPNPTITLILLMGCLDRLALIPRVREFQFQAYGQFGVLARCDIAATLLGAGFVIIGIVQDWPLWTFALGLAIDAITYAALLWLARPRIPEDIPSTPPPKFKSLMSEAFPYLLATASAVAYMQMDVVLIRNLQGDYEAGIFQGAIRVVLAAFMMLVALYSVLLPRIQACPEEDFKTGVQSSSRMMSRLALVLLILTLTIGVPLFPLVLGKEFTEGRLVLACLTPVLCFMGIKLIADAIIIRKKAGWLMCALNGSAAVVNLILNLALIPVMGIYGAAIALIGAYAVAGLGIGFSKRFSWTRAVFLRSLLGR